MIKFDGLTAVELERLSHPARQFAAQVGSARQFAPSRLREARFWLGLAKLRIRIPGPFLVSFPLEFLAGIVLNLIAESAAESARKTIEAARPRALVVWLRRFHQTGYDRFPLKDLFEQLSAWGLLAYTLSDDVIYRSTLAERDVRKWVRARILQLPQGAEHVMGSRAVVAVTWIIGFFGIIPVLLATRSYSGWIQLASVLSFIAAIYLSSVIINRLRSSAFYRSKKFRELYKPIFAQAMTDSFSMSGSRAQTYFEDIKAKMVKRGLDFTSGFVAMPVPDADWQQVVDHAIKHADAIFVDVTDLSANLEWELVELAKRANLERIIFSFGFPEEHNDAEAWQHHPNCLSLDKILGDQWRSRCRKFCYPSRVDRKQEEKLEGYMRNLAVEIYEAVVS